MFVPAIINALLIIRRERGMEREEGGRQVREKCFALNGTLQNILLFNTAV